MSRRSQVLRLRHVGRLGRAFDTVLLASNMINADPGTRREFLATVRRHLHDGGVAVFQQSPPDWFETLEHAETVRDDPGGIAAAGLRFGDWLTDDHAWITGHPV